MLELIINIKPSCHFATAGGTIYYQITVENATEFWATHMTLIDDLSVSFESDSVFYSLDGMETWLPWLGSLVLEDIAPSEIGFLHLRGIVKGGTVGTIENIVSIEGVMFCAS